LDDARRAIRAGGRGHRHAQAAHALPELHLHAATQEALALVHAGDRSIQSSPIAAVIASTACLGTMKVASTPAARAKYPSMPSTLPAAPIERCTPVPSTSSAG